MRRARKSRRRARGAVLGLAACSLALGLLVPLGVLASADATTIALFSDGFESGNLSAWSVATGADGVATVQSATVKSGAYSAAFSETSAAGSYAYARAPLTPAQTDLTATGDFQVQTEGASGGNVPIFRLLDSAGNRVVNLYRQNQSGDAIWVWYGGTYYKTTGRLPLNTWGNLGVHITATGAATGTVEVFVNGATVYQSTAALLPATGIGSVQIGNNSASQTMAMVADNISISTSTVTVTTTTTTTTTSTTSTTSTTASTATTTTTPSVSTTTTTVANSGNDPVIAAAGDIACSPNDQYFNGGRGSSTYCHQLYTSNLLVNGGYTAVLPIGDEQYDCAAPSDWAASYDPSWGRVKSITRPAPGNHEYKSANPDLYGQNICAPNAQGYFQYFGASAGDPSKGYYSYDLGTWHMIVLNTTSKCSLISCAAGSAQETWLKADLAAHPNKCTLAYWHEPLFSSKTPLTKVQPLWQDLYAAGAEVVLNGHVHNYERFAPQDPFGKADSARGIAEFVVGMGGRGHESSGTTIAANSVARNGTVFGVLKMTLHPSSYDWEFVPQAGQSYSDSGSAPCH